MDDMLMFNIIQKKMIKHTSKKLFLQKYGQDYENILEKILENTSAFLVIFAIFCKNKYFDMCSIIFFCIILLMLESLSEGTTQKMIPTVDRPGIVNLSQELRCVLCWG